MLINYWSLLKHSVYSFAPVLATTIARKRYKILLKKTYRASLNYYNHYQQWPLFKSVEIETINRCNNICPFCPVNKNNDHRVFHKMEDSLFLKVVQELHDIQFTGTVNLFSNNEPFLDDRIEGFAQVAKKMLPTARIVVYSNGILITIERLKSILPYVDLLYLDNYNDTLRMIGPIKRIYEYLKQNPEYASRVSIHLRKYNETLFNRGGEAPNRQNEKFVPLKLGCVNPFHQIIIRPDGKISLCCNDAFGQVTLGDINKSTLEEIWQSEMYDNIRRISIRQSRVAMGKLCAKCDTIY